MTYQAVIGLEIHCELMTKSKVFCSCRNDFGGGENTRACPICSGIPGALPLLNQDAVTLAVKAGIALDCKINKYSSFDRKNYFYPDLPKAYQITQFENPICSDGFITVCNDKKIRIERIHIEEDAGKLIHDESTSFADYNRCGVPLIEIVTKPDFGTYDEVRSFVKQLALRLKYADVCDARMEQGSLRVDVNISLMNTDGSLGTRAEIKNLNSLHSIAGAIQYEIHRQSDILDNGGRIIQETRRYDEKTGRTVSMRSKEEAHDYRYFPEPDIPPIILSDEDIENIKSSMPLSPQARYRRYVSQYSLPPDDADLIISSRAFSDFYDEAVSINPSYKKIAVMMLVEVNHHLNESGADISDVPFTPCDIAELVKLSEDGIISKNGAKDILKLMFESGQTPLSLAEKHGFIMSNDTSAVEAAVDKILSEYSSQAAEFKKGSQKILGFLIGQVMREAGKSANPQAVREILIKKLK